MVDERNGMLEEFRSLRSEHQEVQKARLWGAIPYLIIAGAVATFENREQQPAPIVFLIFAALPFLWHTANHERSLSRIAAYIAAVIEPQIPGLGWEDHLREWRRTQLGSTKLRRIVDRWRYVLAITGVYVVVIVFATIVLFTGPGGIWLKTAGASGALLCAEALWYLSSIYDAGERYKRASWEAHVRLEAAKSPGETTGP
jgi:hypothetical protein